MEEFLTEGILVQGNSYLQVLKLVTFCEIGTRASNPGWGSRSSGTCGAQLQGQQVAGPFSSFGLCFHLSSEPDFPPSGPFWEILNNLSLLKSVKLSFRGL